MPPNALPPEGGEQWRKVINSVVAKRILAGVQAARRELVEPGTGTVPTLDALRTLAIVLVFSDHTRASFLEVSGRDSPFFWFPLFHFGWTGVDLFFVLSGFLIGKQLWRELFDTGTIRVGRFLLRRGLRIWPYYFFVVAAIMIANGAHGAGRYWPDLLFISNYIAGGIGGGWSLSTEEQFYVLVPLFLLATRRILPFRFQWVPIFAIGCALPAIRAVTLSAFGPHTHGESALFFVTYAPIHTHCDGLLAGLLLAWIAIANRKVIETRGFLSNFGLPAALALIGVTLRWFNQDLFAFSGLALFYLGATIFSLRDRAWLREFASARTFHVLSRLSYAIYLNHFVVLRSVMPDIWPRLLANLPHDLAFLFGYGTAFALSTILALFTFTIVELPFLRFRDRWLMKDRGSPVEQPVLAAESGSRVRT